MGLNENEIENNNNSNNNNNNNNNNTNNIENTKGNEIILNRQLVAIVTGSSDGLGKVVSGMLAKTNYFVILANRDLNKAKLVLDDILATTANNKNVISMKLDLSSFDSIKEFVNQFKQLNIPLDVLINNAGIYTPPFSLTEGFESQFMVNHLGPFLLTNLLMDKFTENARIINLSSLAHKNSEIFNVEDLSCKSIEKYNALKRYSNSKLYAILFTKELDRILKKNNSKIIALSLHPGVISTTNLFKHLPGYAKFVLNLAQPFTTTVNTASIAIYRLAIGSDPELPNLFGGEYFNINVLTDPIPQALSQENWRLLWAKSCEYCKIEDIGK
ncbi:hypothetical protein RB653_008799 [Dictyostelium firmibasis]|uniref:NAD(P)-binding protein n=1 Tax=Dictyostelium firmibasis TaxID=79012 RepID=A0AAN7U599_9MYCE